MDVHFQGLARDELRRIYAHTKKSVNDADHLGDGDQTPLKGSASAAMRQVWVDGHVWGAWLTVTIVGNDGVERPVGPEVRRIFASDFAYAAASGDVNSLRAALDAADNKAALLSQRHLPLRMPALTLVTAGARLVGLADRSSPFSPSARHVEAATLLLAAGAPLEARDVYGVTALAHACSEVASPTSLAIALLLVNAGADVNTRNRSGRSPLWTLAMHPLGLVPAAMLLLEAGADPLLEDNDGISPQRLSTITHCNLVFSMASSGTLARGRRGTGRTLVGERVELAELKNTAMNGRTGVCASYDVVAMRYSVAVDGGEVVAIKAENCYPLGTAKAASKFGEAAVAACASCRRMAPPLLCGACHAEAYCSAECQRAAWRGGHKAVCKRSAAEVVRLQRPPSESLPGVFGGVSLRGGGSIVDAQSGKELFSTRHLAKGAVVLLKVQRPLHGGGAILIYDAKKEFKTFVEKADAAWAKLDAAVAAHTQGAGVKAFLLATVVSSDALDVDLKPQPPAMW